MSLFFVSITASVQGFSRSGQHQEQAAKSNDEYRHTPNSPKLTPEQKFVLETVQMAAALPAPDPQDRLRLLSTAVDVVSPIDRSMAKALWREGVQIESELIRGGQKPAVSMMSAGQADCAAARTFVENLLPAAVLQAEQSLIAAITSCPKHTLDIVSRKLDAALEKNVVAPRALMAVVEAQGTKSAWSQNHFESLFKSLPEPQENTGEAADLAALYSRLASDVDKDNAAKAGVQLLVWLGKLDDTPQRSLAVNTTTAAMRNALGAELYEEALQSDVSARAVAQSPAKNRNIERPPSQGTSVLDAIRNSGDQSERLRGLPPSERARQAAAQGFAAGNAGDRTQAGKYFDMAFTAADDAWESRTPDTNAAAVVQEVSEAAAQIDPLNALERAQRLRDTSSQAIAMLAVARVVASNGLAAQTLRSPR
jgi:hypothetical protein